MTHRLFIGAVPGRKQLDELKQYQQTILPCCERASLTKEQNLHLTLRFIGEVEESQTKKIIAAVSALEFKPKEEYFSKIKKYGFFDRRDGLLVYADLEVSDEIYLLVEAMETSLRKVGVKPERRKWLPHITVARRVMLSPGSEKLPQMQQTSSVQPFSDVHLFLSEFTPQGMKYTSLVHLL